MGLFNRDDKVKGAVVSIQSQDEYRLTQSADQLRQSAIEYVVSLPKADKDRFFEAVDLIWQGYNKLDRVKTVDERQTERETKANGGVAPLSDDDLDDELSMAFLDDEPVAPNPLVTPPATTEPKKVDVK